MNKVFILSAGILLLGAGCNIVKNNDTAMEKYQEQSNNKPIAQSHRSYDIELTSSAEIIKANQENQISFRIVNDKGEVLKDFVVAHEKIMHFIVVRKDLQYFQHLHPIFNEQTGEFTVKVNFPANGVYRIFPDFTPKPDNFQKLAVTVHKDLSVGDVNKYEPGQIVSDTGILKIVDGYRINYNFPQAIKAQTEVNYSLIIEKSGQAVKLEPYLGAMGHGVILKAGTLDFIHTHALSMDGMGMDNMNHEMNGSAIEFSTMFPEPGKYKIFTQFQVQGKVVTSDYTLDIK